MKIIVLNNLPENAWQIFDAGFKNIEKESLQLCTDEEILANEKKQFEKQIFQCVINTHSLLFRDYVCKYVFGDLSQEKFDCLYFVGLIENDILEVIRNYQKQVSNFYFISAASAQTFKEYTQKFYNFWISAKLQTYFIAKLISQEVQNHAEEKNIIHVYYDQELKFSSKMFQEYIGMFLPSRDYELKEHSYTNISEVKIDEIKRNHYVYITGYNDTYIKLLLSIADFTPRIFTDVGLIIASQDQLEKLREKKISFLSLGDDRNPDIFFNGASSLVKISIELLEELRNNRDKLIYKREFRTDIGNILLIHNQLHFPLSVRNTHSSVSSKLLSHRQSTTYDELADIVNTISSHMTSTKKIITRYLKQCNPSSLDFSYTMQRKMENFFNTKFDMKDCFYIFRRKKFNLDKPYYIGQRGSKIVESYFGFFDLLNQKERVKNDVIQVDLRESSVQDNSILRVFIVVKESSRENAIPIYFFILKYIDEFINNNIEYVLNFIQEIKISKTIENSFDADEYYIKSSASIRNILKSIAAILTNGNYKDVNYIYIFPDESTDVVSTSCYLVFKQCERISYLEKSILSSMVASFFSIIHNALNLDETRISNRRSAKTAIMARNMSHNLGSHVIAYLKYNLGTLSDKILKEINKFEISENLSTIKRKISYLHCIASDDELPFLQGLNHFLTYIQERQDYIATISTDHIPFSMPINFKDMIYDALNPDLKHLRHSERQSGRIVNILLSYIAQSENFSRPFYLNYDENLTDIEFHALDQKIRSRDIVIKFRNFDGINDHPYVEKIQRSESIFVRSVEGGVIRRGLGWVDLNILRKLSISLPGGTYGRQALFSIIENILRNAAKHGNFEKPDNNLVLILDIIDPMCSNESHRCEKISDLFSECEYYDNTLSEKGKSNKATDLDDLYIMTLTVNDKISSEGIAKLQQALQDDYIDSDGKMISTNKGLKEMRISAAWLRRINDEDMVREKKLAPIIQVRKSPEHYLQYIICLPKVLDCVIVDNIYAESTDHNVLIETTEKFKNRFNKCFDLIAIPTEQEREILKDLSLDLHKRVVFIDKNDSIKQIKKEDLYAKLIDIIEPITIFDDKFKSLRAQDLKDLKHGNKQIVEIGSDVGSGGEKYANKYIYKKHLESEREFYDFLLELNSLSEENFPKFAEGISGGNSTDRFVRKSVIDHIWYYKHLSAMQKRIAIIDERLFFYVTGLQSEKLINTSRNIKGNYKAAMYALKNIWVFNIVLNKDHTKFIVFGYKNYMVDSTNANIYSHITKVAELTIGADNNPQIKFERSCEANISFDNISIHQGLLDKIYGMCSAEDKEKITDEIYSKFINSRRDYEIKKILVNEQGEVKEKHFYPRMTIHSGRSKPSKSDMPQYIPFIPFSSIENAFMDCKYSLVELLELSQYE